MLVKFVSLISLICAVAIFSVSIKNPDDPLFFIVAGGLGADLARIMLAGLMVALAFFSIPKKFHAQGSLLVFGSILLALGFSGFLLNSFNYALYEYIKPLDFLLISEAGIVANLVGLEAHRPMFHFSDPYKKAVAVAFLPRLKKIKTPAV